MKFMKYIMAFSACFLLVGCGSGKPSQPGKIEEISITTLREKMQNGEDFAVVITQLTCGPCGKFLEMLNEYLPDHNVVIYDVVMDNQGASRSVVADELEKIFPEFTGTPDLNYIKGGKLDNQFWADYDALDLKNFKDFVKKNNLEAE